MAGTPEEITAFKNLEQVLEDEIKIYRLLLDLVRQEKEILIAAQIEELENNNKAKEAYILKIKSLEKIRERYARELAQQVGANTENPRLLEIAAKLQPAENTKLRAIHTTLDLLIRRIKDLNTSNEVLVNSAIKTVTGALGAIRDTLQPKPTYAPTGEKKATKVAGNFVSKDV